MEKDSYKLLLNYSFHLLGRKNYSEAEISRKFFQRGKKLKLSGLDIAVKKVIKRLQELQYLDDSRILSDYFEYRLKSRPVGKFLFLHEMHRRGIPFEQAKQAWEKRDIDEEPLALQLLESRKRQWKKEKMPPVLRKKKAIQLLTSRGFSPDTIWGLIDSLSVEVDKI
ncbi:regulatory protein RecX [Candidatus Peregrinibacteria bacterium]|nr:regulatory protein RecX [Candidatus Peregrinibacteria bacterium]